MSARKLRYRVQAERDALTQRFADALAVWQRAWSVAAVPLEHGIAAPDGVCAQPQAPWRVLGLSATGLPAVFYRMTEAPHELAARWLGLPLPHIEPAGALRAPIAVALAQRAHDAMLNAIVVETGCVASGANATDGLPDAEWRPFTCRWSGAVLLRSSAAGVGVEWLLSAQTVDRLSPRKTPAVQPARDALVPVPDALAATTKLGLTVQLDQVALSLGELTELRAGDVVTLGHRLDMPLNVVDVSGNPLFSGFLVARDGRKSLKLSADSVR